MTEVCIVYTVHITHDRYALKKSFLLSTKSLDQACQTQSITETRV